MFASNLRLPPPSHSRLPSPRYTRLGTLLALGGFASEKTIFNRFLLATWSLTLVRHAKRQQIVYYDSNQKNPNGISLSSHLDFLVGVTGFEPAASWSRTKRTTKLCHTPIAYPKSIPQIFCFVKCVSIFFDFYLNIFPHLLCGDKIIEKKFYLFLRIFQKSLAIQFCL